jgi:hypothetical protein
MWTAPGRHHRMLPPAALGPASGQQAFSQENLLVVEEEKVVPRGGHPSSEGVPNRPDGRRPDSSPKGITVAGQCRIRTGLRSCVLLREGTAESPETRISSNDQSSAHEATPLASERSPGRAKRGRLPHASGCPPNAARWSSRPSQTQQTPHPPLSGIHSPDAHPPDPSAQCRGFDSHWSARPAPSRFRRYAGGPGVVGTGRVVLCASLSTPSVRSGPEPGEFSPQRPT